MCSGNEAEVDAKEGVAAANTKRHLAMDNSIFIYIYFFFLPEAI